MKTVQDKPLRLGSSEEVARKLALGQGGRKDALFMPENGDPARSRGRAVFLVGAGCSVSAGIPLATGIAKYCACELARSYRVHDDLAWTGKFHDADEALDWLVANKGLTDLRDGDRRNWGALYFALFEHHLAAPNQQKTVINDIIERSGHRLNWAHACLGELVRLRYVHTVLTTNFDQLVLKGMVRAGVLPVVVEGLEGLNKITAEPRYPQLVHLHGSMHTYDARNSLRAVRETKEHGPLNSMFLSLLQGSNLLVVIGYGGGDAGVMELLESTARQLTRCVVCWVMFEEDQGRLSARARALLEIDENKFLLTGMDADRFFKDLMNDLRIGVPQWIREPVSTLADLRDEVVMPGKYDEPEIHAILEDFREQIAAVTNLPADGVAKGAAMRLKGDLSAALDAFQGSDHNLVRDRFRAVTEYDVAQERLGEIGTETEDVKAQERLAELERVVADFERIAEEGGDRDRIQTIRQLLPALISLDELRQDDTLIERVVRHCDAALALGIPQDSDVRTELLLRRALALQVLGERQKDEANLLAALDTYEKVEKERNALRDTSWSEAQAGAATIYQALGEMRGDSAYLRRAVERLSGLLERSHGRMDPMAEAARRYNLAGALRSLAGLDVESAPRTLLRAQTEAVRVVELYSDTTDTGLEMARELLNDIQQRLGAMTPGSGNADR